MRFNKEERRDRRIFTECRNSRHSECPVWIKVKVYRNDRQLGKVFTGRYEKVYWSVHITPIRMVRIVRGGDIGSWKVQHDPERQDHPSDFNFQIKRA